MVYSLYLFKLYSWKTYPEVTGAREVLAVLVEGHGHDSVRCVESLLHTVPMMDVNVYVQHSLVVSGKRGYSSDYSYFSSLSKS